MRLRAPALLELLIVTAVIGVGAGSLSGSLTNAQREVQTAGTCARLIRTADAAAFSDPGRLGRLNAAHLSECGWTVPPDVTAALRASMLAGRSGQANVPPADVTLVDVTLVTPALRTPVCVGVYVQGAAPEWTFLTAGPGVSGPRMASLSVPAGRRLAQVTTDVAHLGAAACGARAPRTPLHVVHVQGAPGPQRLNAFTEQFVLRVAGERIAWRAVAVPAGR